MKRSSLAIPLLISPAVYAQDLPEGKGKDVLENVCGACHPADQVAGRRATKEGWGYIVDDMVSRGAINEYIAKSFAQVNTNKAPSAEIASVLDITAAQADAIVKYRMDHGDFKTLDDVKKVPGLASANLDTKKDRIDFD